MTDRTLIFLGATLGGCVGMWLVGRAALACPRFLDPSARTDC